MLSQLQQSNQRTTNLWKPSPGKTQIRIVPYKFNKDNPFIELYFHYDLGGKNYLSPISFGRPDPIEEFSTKLKNTGNKEDYQLGKKLEAKLRTFVPVIVRGEENEGVKFWGFGKTVYQELLGFISDPDYGDISDPTNGRDVVVEFHTAEETGKSFPSTTIRVKPNVTPVSDNKEVIVAKGGKGGSGNVRFKSSTNRSPRRTTLGQEGGFLSLRLELRLLADVGLLGKPNCGKSSLVSAVSSANPKIADYEFTTLKPSLGVVDYSSDKSFVISDIPGLITGASKGVGLGFQFLKHLSRTRLILQMIDVEGKETKDIEEESKVLLLELEEYDINLTKKVKWLVLNKIDLIHKEKQIELKE